MTDLPGELREQLALEFGIWSAEVAIHRKDDDGTEKLLLTLAETLPSEGEGACPAADRKSQPTAQSSLADRMRPVAQ